MKKVYIVKAVKSYEIEIIAHDEDDAIERANEQPLKDWDVCEFEITDAQLASGSVNEWFGPDRSDEI
jgi:hypothetical protein